MMNLKKMTALFALCSFGLGAAEVSMLNLNRIESSQGLPAGWYPNKRQEFSPLPKVEFPVEQDGKAMHISNIQGREGCRFDSYRVIPGGKGWQAGSDDPRQRPRDRRVHRAGLQRKKVDGAYRHQDVCDSRRVAERQG